MRCSEATSTQCPDFVVIGAMKAGTTTVHEHLAAQPGVAMCRGKETDFFSVDDLRDRVGTTRVDAWGWGPA